MSNPTAVCFYKCNSLPLRKALVAMVKEKKMPLVNPEDRPDVVESISLFPYFWVSESEAGFAATPNLCARSYKGVKLESNTDDIISRIDSWQQNIRVMTPEADFTLYNNGNVRVGNYFIADHLFDEVVIARKKLSKRPNFGNHSK